MTRFVPVRGCPALQCVLALFCAAGDSEFSSAFVAGETMRKWSGFTQDRTRQVWSTTMPSGMGPRYISHEVLWAEAGLCPFHPHPYPLGPTYAIHSQQPVFGSGSHFSSNMLRQSRSFHRLFVMAPICDPNTVCASPSVECGTARVGAERKRVIAAQRETASLKSQAPSKARKWLGMALSASAGYAIGRMQP